MHQLTQLGFILNLRVHIQDMLLITKGLSGFKNHALRMIDGKPFANHIIPSDEDDIALQATQNLSKAHPGKSIFLCSPCHRPRMWYNNRESTKGCSCYALQL